MLILDDWGLVRFKCKQEIDFIYIIEERCGQRSTIIVSQLPVPEWYGVMDNPTVADELLYRVIHNVHRLELTDESQRKKILVQGEEVGKKESVNEGQIILAG